MLPILALLLACGQTPPRQKGHCRPWAPSNPNGIYRNFSQVSHPRGQPAHPVQRAFRDSERRSRRGLPYVESDRRRHQSRPRTFTSATTGTFLVIGQGSRSAQMDTAFVTVVAPQPDLVRMKRHPRPRHPGRGCYPRTSPPRATSRTARPRQLARQSTTGAAASTLPEFHRRFDPGVFRVIALNTAGTVADTSTVTNSAGSGCRSCPGRRDPTAVSRFRPPASSQQYQAYGRTSQATALRSP